MNYQPMLSVIWLLVGPSRFCTGMSDVMSTYDIDLNVCLSVIGDENELPAHVISDMAVSRTFQILYRNEDVMINDVILYRFHTLIDSTRVSLAFYRVLIG